MKSVRSDMPVGFNLAMSDDQPAPEDSHLAEKRADVYGPWLEIAKHVTISEYRLIPERSWARGICLRRREPN